MNIKVINPFFIIFINPTFSLHNMQQQKFFDPIYIYSEILWEKMGCSVKNYY